MKKIRQSSTNAIKGHYGKFFIVAFFISIILSFFFYDKTEYVINLAPIKTFSWVFLIISLLFFLFKDRIKNTFIEYVYTDEEYIEGQEETGNLKSNPLRPIKSLMLFINCFLWLNFIFFVVGKSIGLYIGFNSITSMIAVFCLYGQLFLAFTTFKLFGQNILNLLKFMKKTEEKE